MTGVDEFVGIFGDVTIATVVQVAFAGAFLFLIYKKVKDYLIKRYEAEEKKNRQLKETLDAVSKYPEYRMQSIEIQHKLENEIKELSKAQAETVERLAKMEDDSKRREKNKLRDRLLQNYRYYTSTEHNPGRAWTKMESEAFWELFVDYEDAGGNGYVHTVVQPAMELLSVVDMDDAEGVMELMRSRK